jgi:hypothetical protein
MKPWKAFALTIPGVNGVGSGSRLRTVKHVTHTASALRILEDGRIHRGLIYDESMLNAHRTTVTWLSPNHWHNGFRYGNVEFSFDFDQLVGTRCLYWVESIGYQPPACRFFVTDRDVASLHLSPYDPDTAKGPLQRISGEWWWNSNVTLEIMLDGDLDLQNCCKIDFVKHSDNQCAIDWKICSEMGQLPGPAAARVIAGVLGRGLTTIDHLLVNSTANDVSSGMHIGLSHLPLMLGAQAGKLSGPIKRKKRADILLRAALVQLSVGQKEAARKTVRVLASDEIVLAALARLTKAHVGVPSSLLESAIEA